MGKFQIWFEYVLESFADIWCSLINVAPKEEQQNA